MPEEDEASPAEPDEGPAVRGPDVGAAADEPLGDDREVEGGQRPPGGPSRLTLVVVGLLVGLLVGAAIGWISSRDDGATDDTSVASSTTAPETAEAAANFVEAWERGRTATYLSGSLLERTSGDGVVIEMPIVVAQRPPDRVVSNGSGVDGVVDGERWVCDEQLDGLLRCSSAASAEAFEEDVAGEVATLRGYFDGDLPLYRVSQSGTCFDLRLSRAIQAPPYGQSARFCFDEASGAPSLQRVERTEGTDVVTLVSVRTDVTAEDVARVAAGDVDEALLEG
jgi:hypothetical protein